MARGRPKETKQPTSGNGNGAKAGGLKKRVEGRKPAHALYPKAVREAKRLRRASPKTGERRSFRTIAASLAMDGHVTKAGKPFTATAVKLVEGPAPAGE